MTLFIMMMNTDHDESSHHHDHQMISDEFVVPKTLKEKWKEEKKEHFIRRNVIKVGNDYIKMKTNSISDVITIKTNISKHRENEENMNFAQWWNTMCYIMIVLSYY